MTDFAGEYEDMLAWTVHTFWLVHSMYPVLLELAKVECFYFVFEYDSLLPAGSQGCQTPDKCLCVYTKAMLAKTMPWAIPLQEVVPYYLKEQWE